MQVTESKSITPLWLRITIGVILFIVFGALYGFYYIFWNGMSYWDGMKEDMSKPDQFYLRYVWGAELIILLVVPLIVTIKDTRIIWKVLSWIFSIILSLLGWMVWMILVQ